MSKGCLVVVILFCFSSRQKFSIAFLSQSASSSLQCFHIDAEQCCLKQWEETTTRPFFYPCSNARWGNACRTHCRSLLSSLNAIPIRAGSFFQDNNDDHKKRALVPQENPEETVKKQISSSGVPYAKVLEGLKLLYPPQSLEERNAKSRSDGYWPYINRGKEPPKQYTYGEFDYFFFAQLLDRALQYFVGEDSWNDRVFCDVGSGTGRLVLAAAALHPGWKRCRGVEVLPSIHEVAVETLEKCRYRITDTENQIQKEKEGAPHHDSTFGSTEIMDSNNMDWLGQLQRQFGNDDEEETGLLDSDLETMGFDLHTDNNECYSENSNIAINEEGHHDTTLEEEHHENLQGQANKSNQDEADTDPMYFLPVNHGDSDGKNDSDLLLAPIEFSCGSFEDPYEYIGDVDCVFCFSSCMSETIMSNLAKALGRQCKPGTVIITTEFMLPLEGTCDPVQDDDDMPHGPFEFELLEKVDGWSWLMGGQSTAYIHRVKTSLWQEGVGRRTKPEIPLETQAWRLVQAMEKNELVDTKKFLREVRNNCLFYDFPESWWPSLD